MKSPRTIAITGASSGLGAALAMEYAGPGISLALAARRKQALREVAEQCEAKGADVFCRQLDIRQPEQVAQWVEAIEASHAIDLFIANAGVFGGHGPNGHIETTDELALQIETNLMGTLNSVSAAASYMQNRRKGQIAMISSLAALQPMADAPGYSASKAGIMAYGDALREYLLNDNVTVSVICPGHIDTAQTDMHEGALPGIMSADKAARLIRRRLARGWTFIAFPDGLHILVRLGRLLPWRLRAVAYRPFRFHVNPSPQRGGGHE